MAGNNAGFNRGDAGLVRNRAPISDSSDAKTGAESASGFVFAEQAEGFDACAEGGEIHRDITGSAEALGLRGKINDRNGGFRGKARSGSPQETVEHEVAHDADALALEFWQKPLEARQ